MHLVIVTPQGPKVDAEVSSVTIPGTLGELGILPGHRAFLTSTAVGKFSYVSAGTTYVLATNEGYAEVHDDKIVVVTESAERPDDIDVARANASLDKSQSALKALDAEATSTQRRNLQDKAKRARNRLTVASQHGTPKALKSR